MNAPLYCNMDILECPACHTAGLQENAGALACPACRATYGVDQGIPLLVHQSGAFTRLDDMDYENHHNIDDNRREKVADDWQEIFDAHGVHYGDTLEIGCGTGQLTWGLAKRLPFTSVHACDISHGFLNHLRKDLENIPGRDVNYYLCDANNLPFRENTFDLVVGHSVLHHFIHYEKVIANVQKLLRPGGRAIFYEPIIQGKILVAFFGELMIRTEANTGFGVLDEEDVKKIKHMNRHILKSRWLKNNEAALMKMEDKYIFDILELEKMALEFGYSDFEFANSGKPYWGYKWHVQQHLLMAGIRPEKIQKFTFLFNAFGHTLSELVPENIVTPMGYMIFIK